MDLTIVKWDSNTYNDFISYLKTFGESTYREFHSHLIPDCSIDKFMGIRTPVLRKIGKEISKGDYVGFLKIAGNDYYEEIILQAVVIGLSKPRDSQHLLDLIDFYTPLVDNWATCDVFCSSFKQARKHREALLEKITEFLHSNNPWLIRIALVLLLTYYLDDEYIEKSLELTDNVQSNFYYVSMAQAWLIATAFAKNEEVTMNFFKKCNLDDITFNRTIQKAKESFRVSDNIKFQLSDIKRTLDKHTQ